MMKKKATTLLAVLLMGAIALTGCSAPHTVNGSAEAVSVNGTSVPLGELNFYLRYQQANMQNAYGGMFGETFMNTDITGSGSVYGKSQGTLFYQECRGKLYLPDPSRELYDSSLEMRL